MDEYLGEHDDWGFMYSFKGLEEALAFALREVASEERKTRIMPALRRYAKCEFTGCGQISSHINHYPCVGYHQGDRPDCHAFRAALTYRESLPIELRKKAAQYAPFSAAVFTEAATVIERQDAEIARLTQLLGGYFDALRKYQNERDE
jgi:hypothetical protein